MHQALGIVVAFVAGALLAASSAIAQEQGDVRAGLAFARAMCADCHVVTIDQAQAPNPEAPSFMAVARMPGMSPLALNAFLLTPHRNMPNLILASEDRRDLIAYILSLR